MRILALGDPHGKMGIKYGQLLAEANDCEAVMFMGDCWHVAEDYSDGPKVHVIMGNHEDWGAWKYSHDGIKNIERHGDYTTFMLGGRRFGVIGRIDKHGHSHLMDESPGLWNAITNYGSNQVFFEKDYEKLTEMGKLDVLLTHDAPYPFEIAGDIAGSPWLTEAIYRTQPMYHFGGHMHKGYFQEIRNTRSHQLPAMQDINEGNTGCYGFILDAHTMDLSRVSFTGVTQGCINEIRAEMAERRNELGIDKS